MAAKAAKPSIYEEVIIISQEYLGPAAERFISRQVETHLHKKPENMTREDLEMLIEWIKIAAALLTDDSRSVETFASRLRSISSKK